MSTRFIPKVTGQCDCNLCTRHLPDAKIWDGGRAQAEWGCAGVGRVRERERQTSKWQGTLEEADLEAGLAVDQAGVEEMETLQGDVQVIVSEPKCWKIV